MAAMAYFLPSAVGQSGSCLMKMTELSEELPSLEPRATYRLCAALVVVAEVEVAVADICRAWIALALCRRAEEDDVPEIPWYKPREMLLLGFESIRFKRARSIWSIMDKELDELIVGDAADVEMGPISSRLFLLTLAS